tara:strand:- start:79 stop:1062 length:984 start_codon:yes stop_codon:yes gene_type:complete
MAKVVLYVDDRTLSGEIDWMRGRLAECGHALVHMPEYMNLTHESDRQRFLIESLDGIDAALLGGERFTREVITSGRQLKVISRAGVGYDRVDVQAAQDMGIPVLIGVGSNDVSVAEYAFALVLGLSRRMLQNHDAAKSGNWKQVTGFDVQGKTLGIAGLGRIGRNLALRARAFEMTVIASEPFPDVDFVTSNHLELVDFDYLCRSCDFLSLNLPVTEITRGILNRDRLFSMKAGSYVVNTARGELIDEKALYDALSQGHLSGAGLDVFSVEPPDGSPLLRLDNVILSSHIAGNSSEAITRMWQQATENVISTLSGDLPRGCVVNDMS